MSKLRTVLGRLRAGDWARLCRGINREYYRRRSQASEGGYDLFAADWDACVVLDACRYDLFANRSTLPGTLSAATSRGSATVEWLRANFHERDVRDAVYVTANPQLYDNRDAIDVSFHAVDDVWRDGWDEAAKTIPPRVTTERAVAAAAEYPNKRILVHYLQPHYPFLSSDADWDKRGHVGEAGSFWDDLYRGDLDVPRETVWHHYEANLDLTLPHLRRLVEEVEGKVIVTADHGNMVGERARPIPVREWGHPPGLHTSELVTVPWLECPYEIRRDVRTGTGAGVCTEAVTDGTEDVVADRLRDLGYVG